VNHHEHKRHHQQLKSTFLTQRMALPFRLIDVFHIIRFSSA
jgi:hypothetical protein